MILPTSLMRIRVADGGRKKVNLWIPLFLVWPLAIALMVALSPIALLLCVVWPMGRRFVIAGPRILTTLWAMRGLEVRVNDEGNYVLICFK